ncbi:hypothetical protein BDR26DRAFT_871036 [Obelidium mucronatum]|nr:hypothetical protein BDR26DRAFT_871036 [Obelidium mucronatum]
MSLSDLQIRSGTVLVFAENSSMGQMVRWRDGCRWSASRLQGPFLLYREVEASNSNASSASAEPERDVRFVNTVVRGKTKFVTNGMAKRTLTLTGSDGNRYRVISYFYPSDVGHLYGDAVPADKTPNLATPSQLPEFARFTNKVIVPAYTMPDLSNNAFEPIYICIFIFIVVLSSSSTSSRQVMDSPRNQRVQSHARVNDQRPLYHHHQQQRPTPYPSPHQPSYNNYNNSSDSNKQTETRIMHSTIPIFQIQQRNPQSASSANLSESHESCSRTKNLSATASSSSLASSSSSSCSCGGLGIRKAADYFRSDPFWTEFPVTLAPIKEKKMNGAEL